MPSDSSWFIRYRRSCTAEVVPGFSSASACASARPGASDRRRYRAYRTMGTVRLGGRTGVGSNSTSVTDRVEDEGVADDHDAALGGRELPLLQVAEDTGFDGPVAKGGGLGLGCHHAARAADRPFQHDLACQACVLEEGALVAGVHL